MAAGGILDSTRYSSLHRCCVHRHTVISDNAASESVVSVIIYNNNSSIVPRVCGYFGDRVQGAALSVSVADAHPSD